MRPTTRYIHGTAPPEQQRLRQLNGLINGAFVAFVNPPPSGWVLEVGSGLGLLAADVAAASRCRVAGLELSTAQLLAAVSHERLTYVQGDAHALPFADQAFDLVYARFVLEHVEAPSAVLREIRRVVRPAGRVAVMENDISLVRFDPPCPCFDRVWDRFASLQIELGGDPFVGRRLHRLLRSAGFTGIALSGQPEIHWHGSPGWRDWIGNIVGNVESARTALVRGGAVSQADVDAAIGELRALEANDLGSATFVWHRAVCYRDGRA